MYISYYIYIYICIYTGIHKYIYIYIYELCRKLHGMYRNIHDMYKTNLRNVSKHIVNNYFYIIWKLMS